MKITADTNLLVRLVVADDPAQAAAAERLLAQATLVAVPVIVFCELVWVLGAAYKRPRPGIAAAIRLLLAADSIVTDRLAVEAGLAVMDHGGDFADGATAQQGRALGADVFASFDTQALTLLERQGHKVLRP